MTRQGTHFYNKIGVRQMLAVLAFFVCAVFFFPGIVSANSGADGAGTGGDDGSPTDGAGLYATSTVWSSSASTTWTVPSGVTEIKIKVWGAGGGSGKGNGTVASLAGGPGGYAEGVMTVTPGQELSVKVGAGGSGGDGTSAAGGGGLSWVASGGTPWVIAGSGGGSGQVGPEESPAESKGGAGGGTTGYGGDGGGGGTQNGDNGGDGGGAGTPTAGGAASGGATSGAYLTGGSAEVTANMDGGDGGAGYYGGGGGEDSDNATGGGGGAGGGGSSYVISSASATSTVAGSDTDRTQPGNYTDPDYQSGAGYGAAGSSGSGNSGNDGLVIIYYVSPETVSGTVYESDGVTDVGSGKTIKVVIATTTPGIYSGTTDSNGEYLIEADLFTPTGKFWATTTAAGDNDPWRSVIYNESDGLYVAVGNSGTGDRVITSPDGTTWTARTSPVAQWNSVTYGEGLYVAVGGGGTYAVMTSPDGTNWTGRNAAGDDDTWQSVTYGNGTFVAVGVDGDKVMYSSDGITWSTASIAGIDDSAWTSVTYGEGIFVAVACGSGSSCNAISSDRFMSSSNGSSWRAGLGQSGDNTGSDDGWKSVTYGNGTFVAVSGIGDRVAYSSGGAAWATTTAAGNNDAWQSVTYGNGRFVAVACGSGNSCNTTESDRVMVSSDGVMWTTYSTDVVGNDDYWWDITYGDNLFVAVGYSGDRVMLSEPGVNETTPITVYVDGNSIKASLLSYGFNSESSTASGNDLVDKTVQIKHISSGTVDLAVANHYDYDNDTDILIDLETATTTVGIVGTATTSLYSVATTTFSTALELTGDLYLGVVSDVTDMNLYLLGSSTIASTLSGVLNSVEVSGDAAINTNASTTDLTVTTGATLSASSSVTLTGDFTQNGSIDFANNTLYVEGGGSSLSGDFVDTNNLGDVVFGVDKLTSWATTTVAGDAGYWRGIAYGSSTYVAVAYGGGTQRVMSSSDALTWTVRTAAGDNDAWRAVAYGNGTFVAVSSSGDRVMTSPDGITWTARSAADNNDSWFDVTYGNGTFVAVGTATDRVMTSPDGITWTVETAADDDDSWYDIIYVSEDERFIAAALTGERIIMASPVIVELPDVSMQDMVIHSGFIRASSSLEVMGNYTNNDIFSASTSEVVFAGTSQQTATGTLSGDSAFYDLTVSNASQDGATNQSVIFGMPIEVTNTFSMSAGTSARFPAGATSTLENIDLQGTSGNEVYLRSSSNGSYWSVDVPGEQTNVLYVNVKDSYASSTITAYNSTDGTNNVNWSFDTLITGSTTVANHDATQVNNAFNFQNKTNEAIFAFKLIPESGTATVTDLTLTITGAEKVDQNDFSNIRLYRDNDNDAAYDASDEQVGGAGTMEIAGDTGTITFTGDFLSTTTKNYIVVIDWNAPSNGSYMTINLFTSGVTAVDGNGTQDIYGSVSRVQHSRNNRGGGGSPSSQIGGAPPAGDGDVGGGGSGGGADPGEQIGSDPNYKRPSANSGSWTNGANAYDQTDGTYATDNADASETYSNHGFAYSGTTVDGVEVRLEVSGSTAAGSINVELSWNGGVNWTTAKSTGTLSDSDTVVSVGGATDTWGRTWSLTDFSDANFRVRLTSVTSSNTVQVDEIQVRAYVSTSGGGSGGGGGSDI